MSETSSPESPKIFPAENWNLGDYLPTWTPYYEIRDPELYLHYGWKQALEAILAVFDESREMKDIRNDGKLENARVGINDYTRLNEEEFIAARKVPEKIQSDERKVQNWKIGYHKAIWQVNNHLASFTDPSTRDTWGVVGEEEGKVEGIRKGLKLMLDATGGQEIFFYLKYEFIPPMDIRELGRMQADLSKAFQIDKLRRELGGQAQRTALGAAVSGESNRCKLIDVVVATRELKEEMQEQDRIAEEKKQSSEEGDVHT